MKLGLVSDIHGNWKAFEVVLAVLIEEEKVDRLLNCGDVVGYGPDPNQCIDALIRPSVLSVRGNHDAGLLGDLSLDFFNAEARDALNWTRKNLSARNKDFLAEIPEERYREEFDLAMVHGSFVNPLVQYIRGKRDAYQSLRRSNSDFKLQIFGHTHLPAFYEVDGRDVNCYEVEAGAVFELSGDKRYLVNPGSVGQPRDGNWKTSFAVLNVDESGEPKRLRFYRKEYPAEKTRQEIIDAGLPRRLGDRLLQGS